MIKVIELFGGIGAVHAALDRVIGNGKFEIIEMVENNKTAVKAYNLIHNTQFIPQDVLTWDKDIQCDYLHASTPCQAFSVNGKGLGASDDRGFPLWEATIRIIKKTKPKIITLENVKGLLALKHKELFNYYISELVKLGYTTKYITLNAKEFGVPQNRERVFLISVKEELENKDNIFFSFFHSELIPKYEKKKLSDILEIGAPFFVENAKINKNTKYVYIRNQMSLYKNNVVEIDLTKALDETPNYNINIVAVLKDMKWDDFSPNNVEIADHKITTLQDYKFLSGDAKYNTTKGVSQTINAHSLNDNSIIKVEVKMKDDNSNKLKDYTFMSGGARYNNVNGINAAINTNGCSDATTMKVETLNDYPHASTKSQYSTNGIIRTVDTRSVGQLSLFDVSFNEDSKFKSDNGISGTLTATNAGYKNKILSIASGDAENLVISYRKLTALECNRLMSFTDEDYNKMILGGLSNAQIGKLLGNSIVVNVMEYILNIILKEERRTIWMNNKKD